jgi:hypothetical protein
MIFLIDKECFFQRNANEIEFESRILFGDFLYHNIRPCFPNLYIMSKINVIKANKFITIIAQFSIIIYQ